MMCRWKGLTSEVKCSWCAAHWYGFVDGACNCSLMGLRILEGNCGSFDGQRSTAAPEENRRPGRAGRHLTATADEATIITLGTAGAKTFRIPPSVCRY